MALEGSLTQRGAGECSCTCATDEMHIAQEQSLQHPIMVGNQTIPCPPTHTSIRPRTQPRTTPPQVPTAVLSTTARAKARAAKKKAEKGEGEAGKLNAMN